MFLLLTLPPGCPTAFLKVEKHPWTKTSGLVVKCWSHKCQIRESLWKRCLPFLGILSLGSVPSPSLCASTARLSQYFRPVKWYSGKSRIIGNLITRGKIQESEFPGRAHYNTSTCWNILMATPHIIIYHGKSQGTQHVSTLLIRCWIWMSLESWGFPWSNRVTAAAAGPTHCTTHPSLLL